MQYAIVDLDEKVTQKLGEYDGIKSTPEYDADGKFICNVKEGNTWIRKSTQAMRDSLRMKVIETGDKIVISDPSRFTQKLNILKVGEVFRKEEYALVDRGDEAQRKYLINVREKLDKSFLRTHETMLVVSYDDNLALWTFEDPGACISNVVYRGDGLGLDPEYQQPMMRKCLGLRLKINSIVLESEEE